MNTTSFVIENARIVLADRDIANGFVTVENGLIAEVDEGRAPERGLDFKGDLLLPGLVELHTDHIEAHVTPRPKVDWDPVSAVVSYDAQIAASGITTVLDSLRVWPEENSHDSGGQAAQLSGAIDTARNEGLLRVEHFLHLRCEVPMPEVVRETASLIGRSDVRLISLMDHTPGQRQFRDVQKLREYYQGKTGMSDDALDAMFAKRLENAAQHAERNYRDITALATRHGTPMASHDDTTLEHANQAIADKVAVAEFPTTIEAAKTLHQGGVRVMMGAPNLIRGGSHSGNVATSDLANEGTLDIMSSDYVPSSLLAAALRLPGMSSRYDLAAAIRTVSKTPAGVVGLTDRGEIAAGKRADLIRVHRSPSGFAVRSVWNAGQRVI